MHKANGVKARESQGLVVDVLVRRLPEPHPESWKWGGKEASKMGATCNEIGSGREWKVVAGGSARCD